MKQIQVEANCLNANELIRKFVKRIHKGWYTIFYNGIVLDYSTVCEVKYNKHGKLKLES